MKLLGALPCNWQVKKVFIQKLHEGLRSASDDDHDEDHHHHHNDNVNNCNDKNNCKNQVSSLPPLGRVKRNVRCIFDFRLEANDSHYLGY